MVVIYFCSVVWSSLTPVASKRDTCWELSCTHTQTKTHTDTHARACAHTDANTVHTNIHTPIPQELSCKNTQIHTTHAHSHTHRHTPISQRVVTQTHTHHSNSCHVNTLIHTNTTTHKHTFDVQPISRQWPQGAERAYSIHVSVISLFLEALKPNHEALRFKHSSHTHTRARTHTHTHTCCSLIAMLFNMSCKLAFYFGSLMHPNVFLGCSSGW